ncbi:MAG: DNA replication/repair protein RecF [Gammaproteobacteria bacterium]|nr:DNA replication/repair protein RecF [Gammaproteobacteria bacterium]
MQIQKLTLHHFRNHQQTCLLPDPHLNYLYGENASGKSSVLEAIHLLGFGKSFTHVKLNDLIHHGSREFVVNAEVFDEERSLLMNVGFSKSKSQKSKIQINRDSTQKLSDLVQLFPIQTLHPTSSNLILSQSKLRRQLIDWGVFHVEHQFQSVWRRYARVLEQRNRALKYRLTAKIIASWDQQLIPLALKLSRFRAEYVELLRERFNTTIEYVMPENSVELDFYRGWHPEFDLPEALLKQLPQDFKQGYSSVGAHRADLMFKMNGLSVKGVLSRGQVKLITFAIKLAQLQLLTESTASKPILLIDDLNSELDEHKRSLLFSLIEQMGLQTFVTNISIDDSIFDCFPSYKLFHVKQGGLE